MNTLTSSVSNGVESRTKFSFWNILGLTATVGGGLLTCVFAFTGGYQKASYVALVVSQIGFLTYLTTLASSSSSKGQPQS
jgi:hypothetical protein